MPDLLPPDPDAIEQWQKLTKNQPSKRALPPVTGGARWLWGLIGFAIVISILVLLQRGGG